MSNSLMSSRGERAARISEIAGNVRVRQTVMQVPAPANARTITAIGGAQARMNQALTMENFGELE